jgi:subtilase family serine protease
LYTTDDLYVDCAIANIGTASASNFHITLYIDDVLELSWLKRNTAKPNWYYWWKRINIGQLSAGTHRMKLVVDSGKEVTEINEGDNEYTRTIEVKERAAGQPEPRLPRSLGSMTGAREGSAPLD